MMPIKQDKCSGCKYIYFHNKIAGLYSGMIMKTSGNYYCTFGKKHRKLKMSEVRKELPSNCPAGYKKEQEREG